jgi:hypothetical protein
MSDGETVVVESDVGPVSGYYHKPASGTWLGPERMSREEAENLGYSRCQQCFDDCHANGGETA